MTLDQFVQYYQETFRAPLFTGFLTLTGFLFSVKAFLFANLQKEIYQDPDYQARVFEVKKLDDRAQVTTPLRTLNRKLYWCILFTFAASMSQFSIGLFDNWLAASTCVLLALCGVIAVVVALFAVRNVTIDWMDHVEEKANRLRAAKTKTIDE